MIRLKRDAVVEAETQTDSSLWYKTHLRQSDIFIVILILIINRQKLSIIVFKIWQRAILFFARGVMKVNDLKNMNFDELQEMRTQIDVELKKRQAKEKQNARRKILEIASTHGIDIADLVSKERHYRNPNNQWELWNGRGRRPKWIKEWLENGYTLDELEVT